MRNSIEISESIDAVRGGKPLKIEIEEDGIDFFPVIKGFLLPSEKRLLYHLAKQIPEKGVVVEIGCLEGLSAYFLARGAAKKSGRVYSIDLFSQRKYEDDQFQEKYEKSPGKEDVDKKLRSYGIDNIYLIQEKSNEAAKNWKYPADLLFIDGNHEYGKVKEDILSWSSHLKKGGIMVLHDANTKKDIAGMPLGLEGPGKAIQELIKEDMWKNQTYSGSLFFAEKR